MDFFVVKKLVSTVLHLLPGALLLILATVLLLRRRAPRLAFSIIGVVSALLLALHSPPVANALINSLERQTLPLPALPDDTGAVLVLGSGHVWDEDRAPNARLMATALSRLTEAARLWKTRPDTTLITSGAPFLSRVSHARAMADMAWELGVASERLVLLEDTRDTIDEITAAADVVRTVAAEAGRPLRLVVVSSATHLPRAGLILDSLDIDYALAPTDYLALPAPWYRLDGYFLYSADRAIHEYVGMLWYRLRYG